MPLSTINTEKELAVSARPLLLVDVTFSDGHVARFSTQSLTAADGSAYSGNDYAQRVESQDLDRIQALGPSGIDSMSRLSFRLADADRAMWTSLERDHGFRGAEIVLRFVMWTVGSADFTSDSRIFFAGTCDAATWSNNSLTVTAQNNALTKVFVPGDKISPRCTKLFPSNAAQRLDGYGNRYSPFSPCGYAPEYGEGVNGPGAVPFTDCPRTIDACVERGLATRDGAGLITIGAFNNNTFNPPKHFRSRAYGEKKPSDTQNAGPVYGQLVPEVIGTAWVDGRVISSFAEGNSTRGEVIVCSGLVGDGVLRVVVGGVEVPRFYATSDPLFGWRYVNVGGRKSAPLQDAGFDGRGDAHGSRLVIEVVVYKQLTDNLQSAGVRVLTRGPQVRVWSDPNTFTDEFSDNPAWHIANHLLASEYDVSGIDLQTFINGAAIHDATVNYTDQNGVARTRPRHAISMSIQNRMSVSELVEGLRRGCGVILVKNGLTGKLEYYVKGTLASEQPSPISGSNYNTPIASVTRAGVATNGYAAYKFEASNIVGKIEVSKPKNSEVPNRNGIQIINRDNSYAEDSVSVTDTLDVERLGFPVEGGPKVLGINTGDQARRMLTQMSAEALRGNHNGDTSGTESFTFTTTFKAAHLRVGHLVLLDHSGFSLSNQVCRVDSIQVGQDWEQAKITVSRHSDAWYRDDYGASADQVLKNPGRARPDRPALQWFPAEAIPDVNDSLFTGSPASFGVKQRFKEGEDGTGVSSFEVYGKAPVTRFASTVDAPFSPLQASTSSSGGTIPGSRAVYIQLRAIKSGAAGALSSPLTIADITATGNTNQVTVSGIVWPSGTTNYEVYAGVSPWAMTRQSTGSGMPSSLTLTSLTLNGAGAPDTVIDKVRARAYEIVLPGVYDGAVTAKSGSDVTCSPDASWTTNQHAGRAVSFYRTGPDGTVTPLLSYVASSNTGNVLTLDRAATDIQVGDIVVIRAASDGAATSVVTDSGLALATDTLAGHRLMVISGAGAGQSRTIKGNTSTAITLESPLEVPLATSSRFIVTRSGAVSEVETPSIQNQDSESDLSIELPVPNIAGLYLIEARTVDERGAESPLFIFRESYLSGATGSIGGITPPDDVVPIGAADFIVAQGIQETDVNGLAKNTILVTYDPPQPLGSFIGVACSVRDGAVTRFVGNFDYNGTGSTAPGRYGSFRFLDDTFSQPGNTPEFLLTSRSNTYTKEIDATTPSVVAGFAGYGGEFVGAEWTANASAFTVNVDYRYDQEDGYQWRLRSTWTPPADERYGGSRFVIRPFPNPFPVDSEDRILGPFLIGADGVTTDWFTVGDTDTAWNIYLPAQDVKGRENTINTNPTAPNVLTPNFTANITRADAILAIGKTQGVGKEYADFVTSFTVTPMYEYDETLKRGVYFLRVQWVNPIDERFCGFRLVYRENPPPSPVDSADIERDIQYETRGTVPTGTQTFDWGRGDQWVRPPANQGANVYARSLDWDLSANLISTSGSFITPVAAITVTPEPLGSAGQEHAPLVTSPTGGAIRLSDGAGVDNWAILGQFVEPASPKYGGVRVLRLNAGDPMSSAVLVEVKRGSGKYAGFQPSEPNAISITYAFLSFDLDGNTNTYVAGVTPTVDVVIGAQGNTLNLTKAADDTLQINAFSPGIQPVAMVSALPSLPSSLYPPLSFFAFNNGATRKLYRVNSTGNGYEEMIHGTQDVQFRTMSADRIIANSLTATELQAGIIGTGQLFAGEILVGGGGGKPTRFRVNDALNNMIGFVGDNGAGFQGAYFVNLRVGTNINAPSFYADASQVFLNNVPLTINLNGVITQVANAFNVDGYKGLIVKNTDNSFPAVIEPGGFQVNETASSGTRYFLKATSVNTVMGIYAPGTLESFRITAQSGGAATLRVRDAFGSLLTCPSGAISYQKPGGASGTINIVAGLVTSWT